MNDRERLQWILKVTRGAERCAELTPINQSNLLFLLRGVRLMTISTDAAIAANQDEFDRMERLADRYINS